MIVVAVVASLILIVMLETTAHLRDVRWLSNPYYGGAPSGRKWKKKYSKSMVIRFRYRLQDFFHILAHVIKKAFAAETGDKSSTMLQRIADFRSAAAEIEATILEELYNKRNEKSADSHEALVRFALSWMAALGADKSSSAQTPQRYFAECLAEERKKREKTRAHIGRLEAILVVACCSKIDKAVARKDFQVIANISKSSEPENPEHVQTLKKWCEIARGEQAMFPSGEKNAEGCLPNFWVILAEACADIWERSQENDWRKNQNKKPDASKTERNIETLCDGIRLRFESLLLQEMSGVREEDVNKKQEEVVFEDCNKLNEPSNEEAKMRLMNYFRALAHFAPKKDYKEGINSVCKIGISKGFVSPLFLLSGLLPKLGEDWGKMLSKFRRQLTDVQGLRGSQESFKEAVSLVGLQAFMFDCWLLWGPSIPLPKPWESYCHHWGNGQFWAAQFGFGDENNSIPLIISKEKYHDEFQSWSRECAKKTNAYQNLLAPHKTHKAGIQYPFASFASLQKGRLKFFNGDITLRNNKLVEDLHNPMVGAQYSAGDPDWDTPFCVEGTISFENTKDAIFERYYSAYLWIMFVIVIHKNNNLVEVDSSKPWMGMLPFFEHGNIADFDTYEILEEHLAIKCASTLQTLVKDLKEQKIHNISFIYACASDDLGCPHCDGESSDADGGESKGSFPGLNTPGSLLHSRVRKHLGIHSCSSENLVDSGIWLPPPAKKNESSGRNKEPGPLDSEITRIRMKYSGCHLLENIAVLYKSLDEDEIT